MTTTTDPQDDRLRQEDPDTGLQKAYLVLSEAERARGFVRPLRRTYVHRFDYNGEKVPVVLLPKDEEVLGGCGAATTMATAIAETYATNPKYYAATYCVGCRAHLPVREFHWDDGSFEAVGS